MYRTHPAAADLVNEAGDRNAEHRRLQFRCGGCSRPHKTVTFAHTPVYAKYECRFCGYVSTIKTREEAFDQIEAHVEEGAYEQQIGKRKSVNIRIADTPFGRAALIE